MVVTDVVRAGGGVVVRRESGALQVLVVHRPRYDDWTFPKGKAAPRESEEDCALREVEEETGLTCLLGRELPTTSYTDARGRPKTVRYWQMTSVGGAFTPGREVDEIRWLAPEEAAAILTHERDRKVLRSLEEHVPEEERG